MTTEEYKQIILGKIDPSSDYIKVISSLELDSAAATQDEVRKLYRLYLEGVPAPKQEVQEVQEEVKLSIWARFKQKMGW